MENTFGELSASSDSENAIDDDHFVPQGEEQDDPEDMETEEEDDEEDEENDEEEIPYSEEEEGIDAEALEAEEAVEGEKDAVEGEKDPAPPRQDLPDMSAGAKQLRSTVPQHPVAGFPDGYPIHNAYAFVVPLSAFENGATHFSRMSPEERKGANQTKQQQHGYMRLIGLWGKIVSDNSRLRKVKGKFVPVKDGELPPGAFVHDDCIFRQINTFIERLVTKAGETRGFRFWIFVHDKNFDVDAAFDEVLNDNEIFYENVQTKIRDNKGVKAAISSISGINSYRKVADPVKYHQQVLRQYYDPDDKILAEREKYVGVLANKTPFAKDNNAFRPTIMFAARRAMKYSKISGVCARQKDMREYFYQNKWIFPFPECVWAVASSAMDPQTFFQSGFPRSGVFNCFVAEKKREAMPAPEPSLGGVQVSDMVYDPNADPEAEKFSVAEKIRQGSHVRSVAVENEKLRNDIMSSYTEGSEQYISAMKEFKEAAGEALWEELKKCDQNRNKFSPAIRAVMNFIKCSPAEGMYPEFPTIAENLDSRANAVLWHFMASDALKARDGGMQRMFALNHLMSLDATNPDDTDVSTNGLMLNAGASGKSYVLNGIMYFSIPGTCMTSSKMSDAARTVSSSPFEGMIITQHEASLNEMGLNDKLGENPILKSWLSEKFLTQYNCKIDEETKERLLQESLTVVRGVMLMGLNESIPEPKGDKGGTTPPILTRFTMMRSLSRFKGYETSTHAAVRGSNSRNAPHSLVRQQQMRAIQAAIILYNAYVEAGVLADPNLMEAEETILAVDERLRAAKYPPLEPRTATSIKRLVRSMTLWTAAQVSMGSEAFYQMRREEAVVQGQTEDRYKAWTWRFLLLMERNAVATKSEIAYVLSLIEEEIVPYIRLRICQAMREVLADGDLMKRVHDMPLQTRGGTVHEARDPNFKLISCFSYNMMCKEVAKKIGLDMTAQTVSEHLTKMHNMQLETPDGKFVPWVIPRYSLENSRRELAVATVLLEGDYANNKSMPSTDWMMNQLTEIWSHHRATPQRILHVNPLPNAKSIDEVKTLSYIDVERAPRARARINMAASTIGMNFIRAAGKMPHVRDEHYETSQVLWYNVDEAAAAFERHFNLIGVERSLVGSFLPVKIMQDAFEARDKHPAKFKNYPRIGYYPEDWLDQAEEFLDSKSIKILMDYFSENVMEFNSYLDENENARMARDPEIVTESEKYSGFNVKRPEARKRSAEDAANGNEEFPHGECESGAEHRKSGVNAYGHKRSKNLSHLITKATQFYQNKI